MTLSDVQSAVTAADQALSDLANKQQAVSTAQAAADAAQQALASANTAFAASTSQLAAAKQSLISAVDAWLTPASEPSSPLPVAPSDAPVGGATVVSSVPQSK